MAKVIGVATGPANRKKALLVEALQAALENAPPPSPHFDIQNFRLLRIDLDHGGFTGATRTRVTLDVYDGPMKGSVAARRNTSKRSRVKRRAKSA